MNPHIRQKANQDKKDFFHNLMVNFQGYRSRFNNIILIKGNTSVPVVTKLGGAPPRGAQWIYPTDAHRHVHNIATNTLVKQYKRKSEQLKLQK